MFVCGHNSALLCELEKNVKLFTHYRNKRRTKAFKRKREKVILPSKIKTMMYLSGKNNEWFYFRSFFGTINWQKNKILLLLIRQLVLIVFL